jgi:hypothetical protein
MGAKQKLNQVYIGGSLLLAAVAGGLCDSFVVFIVAAIVLLSLNVHAGDIR